MGQQIGVEGGGRQAHKNPRQILSVGAKYLILPKLLSEEDLNNLYALTTIKNKN